MAIDRHVNIVYDNSQPMLVYSLVTHVEVPDEELFYLFLMRERDVQEGFVGLIAGLDTAKFVAEHYHTKYTMQCAIVAEQGGNTIYWPPPAATVPDVAPSEKAE